jgi:tRNA(fMet)-specific endonuclease VapC
MALVLDTSVLIEVERGALHLAELADSYPDDEFMTAAITISELLHGMHRAKSFSIRATRQTFIEDIVARCEVLPFDLGVARLHGKLWAELASKGAHIGAHDLQIAAITLANRAKLVSRDKRSFPKIGGLEIIQW